VIVRLTAETAPEIIDRDRVDRLHASADGPLGDMLLEPICRVADDEHVWVQVSALRNACEPVAGAEAFDATIAYATSKGWLDPSGDHVRAHVESAD
jgi:hypothetical protein